MKDLFDTLPVVNNSAGKLIKSFRNNFNITLKELSELTGITEPDLIEIECDLIPIGKKRAKLIGMALGILPEHLVFPVK